MPLRERLRAAILNEPAAAREAPLARREEAASLRVVESPLDGLPKATRERLRECARDLDMPEAHALALAVRELHLRLRRDESEAEGL